MLFLLGGEALMTAYQVFRLHRFNWSIVPNVLVLSLIAFRYARIIYRRLPR